MKKTILIVSVLLLAASCNSTQSTNQPTKEANCVNAKYGYELSYPADWKVLTSGNGESRAATCSEGLAAYTFAKDQYSNSPHSIFVTVYTRQNQTASFWKGLNSLEDYAAKYSSLKIQKETKLDGERLVWLGNPKDSTAIDLAAYHNGSIYSFSPTGVDDQTLNSFLSSFKFR